MINESLFLNENFLIIIVMIAVWDLIWKLTAGYKAAGNKHPIWFFFLMVINTIGILPIIYLLTHMRKKDGGDNENIYN